MNNSIADNLAAINVALPEPPEPVASYAGFVKQGGLVFVSGQLPLENGELIHPGLLGADVTTEEAVIAARICAVNILAQVNKACNGDLERIVQCVKLVGFVASVAQFGDHPQVVNGASDFMRAALGIRGVHARAAVGVASLPFNSSVEVEAIFAIV